MRSRYDDVKDVDELDEPVTLTSKELSSLKFGARAGMFALILSLLAAGAAGWTMYQGTKKAPAEPVAVTAAPAAAPAAVDTSTASSVLPPSEASPSVTATPSPAPGGPGAVVAKASKQAETKHSTKTMNASSTRASRTARTASHATAPKMESFDPTPAPPSAGIPNPGIPTPTPTPVPVAPEAHKSAPADTSAH